MYLRRKCLKTSTIVIYSEVENRLTLFSHVGWTKTTKKNKKTTTLRDDRALTVFILLRQWRSANFAYLVSQFL